MDSSSTRQRSRLSRKRLYAVAQISISAVLLFVVMRRVQWSDLKSTLAQMDLTWLAVAWCLFFLGIAVRALRWQVLLQALQVHRSLGELMLWYFVGGFFNVLLPTGFGGDAVRVLELSRDERRVGPVLNSVVVDRYLGLMALLAMGLIAGAVRPDLAPGPVLGLIALLLFGGIAAAWLLTRPWWRRWAQGAGLTARLVRTSKLATIASGLSSYSPALLARAVTASVVFNLIQIGWNAAIALGLGLRLPPLLFFVFVPLTSVALLLPAFGGLGVRELTYVTLLGSVGVPQASAVALSLTIYAVTVASGLVGGVLYLGQGLRRARRKG